MSDIPMRKCTKCKEWFPETTEYFCQKKGGKNGFSASCKECESKRHRQYRIDNRDKLIESSRQWRISNLEKDREYQKQYYADNRDLVLERQRQRYKNNPDKYCERQRQWYARNPNKVRERHLRYYTNNRNKFREYGSQYYTDNRDKFREYSRLYRISNPDKTRAIHHRRRARKIGNGGSHTAADIQLQIKSQTNRKGQLRCWWCGNHIKDTYHVDHRIALHRGGSNGADNIVISCAICNLKKGSKLLSEWNGRLL